MSCDSSRVTFESNAKKRKLQDDVPFRRITRSYYAKENERKRRNEVEVSESSCVESNSGVDFAVSMEKVCNDVVSTASKASKSKTREMVELSDEISKNQTVSIDESVVEQKSKSLGFEADLDVMRISLMMSIFFYRF